MEFPIVIEFECLGERQFRDDLMTKIESAEYLFPNCKVNTSMCGKWESSERVTTTFNGDYVPLVGLTYSAPYFAKVEYYGAEFQVQPVGEGSFLVRIVIESIK